MTTTTTMNEPVEEPAPASSAQPKSQPPPLPQSASRLTPGRVAADAAFAERMFERLAANDYEGALLAAEALLVNQPQNHDALDCAQMARSDLRKVYVARLASLDRIPHLRVMPQGLLALPLDFRAGFLLSRIDGHASLAEIVETCGLSQLDALRVLSELYLQRVIALEG